MSKVKKKKVPIPVRPGKTVDEIIAGLPRQEQVMTKKLRQLILECLPKATEKISYEVPFYTHNRMICFIWPPSVFWGPERTLETQTAKGLALGFCQGNRMSNDDGALLAEGRKQIYCMYFHKMEEINEQQIRSLLYEAGMVDESFSKKKKK